MNADCRFTYHPFEVALCGYSGSGKTTLEAKLLARGRDRYRVSFVKHDAHRFEMDRPGKDTHQATEAGAAGVMINDPRHFARISTLPYSRFERATAFTDADFVLAEGFKHSDFPKLLLLGVACPRRVLLELAPPLLDLPDLRALDNANTPADYAAARYALHDDAR